MPRPRKCRNICRMPQFSLFGPLNNYCEADTALNMTVDEYETIRWIDLEELTQEECSVRMNVARTTIQLIYNDARKKLAQSLVNGRTLQIQGGEYRICDGGPRPCGRDRCPRCMEGKEGGEHSMSVHKADRFENPVRLAELDPENTLIKAGFKENMSLCDIGAGSGIFSFPAARISRKDIYALEIDDVMIEWMINKSREHQVPNLKVLKVGSDALPLEDQSCDMAVMVTVFHELEDKEWMLKEIRRVLKNSGRLLIVEFHSFPTPMGPPVEHRISEETVKDLCARSGYRNIDRFLLGEDFYSLVFENAK